jgi:hypothetical protein
MFAALAWCLAIGLLVTLIDHWRRPLAIQAALKRGQYLAIVLGLGLGTLFFGTIAFVLHLLTLGVSRLSA